MNIIPADWSVPDQRNRLALAVDMDVSRRSRRRDRSTECSPLLYWLVIKPFVAFWLAFIPYGYAHLAAEMTAPGAFSLEGFAVLVWLGIMVFWPNPREASPRKLLSVLEGIRVRCLCLVERVPARAEVRPVQPEALVSFCPRIEPVPRLALTDVIHMTNNTLDSDLFPACLETSALEEYSSVA